MTDNLYDSPQTSTSATDTPARRKHLLAIVAFWLLLVVEVAAMLVFITMIYVGFVFRETTPTVRSEAWQAMLWLGPLVLALFWGARIFRRGPHSLT